MSQLTDAIAALDQSAATFGNTDAAVTSATSIEAQAKDTQAAHVAADAAAVAAAQSGVATAKDAEVVALADVEAKTQAVLDIIKGLRLPSTPVVPNA